MKIAIIGPTHPIKGGIALHTTALSQHLTDAGHEVLIVSWRKQYPNIFYPGVQNVLEREYSEFSPVDRILRWNRPDTWIRGARKSRNYDLTIFIHVNSFQSALYRVMTFVLRRSRTSKVIICHNVLPHERQRFDKIVLRSFFNSVDRIIVHTDLEKKLARSITKTRVDVAQLAPHFPKNFIPRKPTSGEHRRLLFFGFVRPYKGLDVLIRALAIVPLDIQLRIAGEFWGGSEPIKQLCNELHISEKTEIIDFYVPSSQIPNLFLDVDALVLPYREATSSQAVWTAFEFGVPVIATRSGRIAESIQEGIDGLITEPNDPESLARAIEIFYESGTSLRLRDNVTPIAAGPFWHEYIRAVTGM